MTAVYLTMGRRPTPLTDCEAVAERDLYDLGGLDLTRWSGLLIGTAADQISLEENRDTIDRYVERGGIVVVCGQVARPFLTGLPAHQPIEHHRPADLAVTRLAAHPVWDGVLAEDLTFRKGVAGFYGRGCYPDLPAGAIVINGIGPDRLPLDFAYRRGRGTVLVHGGNDLWGYRDDPNTAARLTPQLLAWIAS